MTNIGIDFGSTYTMVSVYTGTAPETVQTGRIDRYPSVVAYHTKTKKYFFGESACSKIGTENIIIFRGFKMLLNQETSDAASKQELEKRGYTGENTPEHITKLFLEYVIKNTLKSLGEFSIHMLIVGVPLCWCQSINTIDARGTLRSICENLEVYLDGEQLVKIEKIKMVSEPENASAYTAWNYEKDMKQQLNGKILVIDYGGGTLDTALVEVQHINGGLRIKPEMRSGAGENHSGKIGNAGIAFQESVVRSAITEQLGVDFPYNDKDFNECLQKLEDNLITSADEIEETMEEYHHALPGLKEEELCTVTYAGTPITITYYHLYENYMKEIQPVLEKVLDDTVNGLDKKEIESLHISMVGGFCGFCLVRFQIQQYFHITKISSDPHLQGMIRAVSNREKAIAHGAALIASGEVTVCDVANISIGAYATYADGTVSSHYAICCGQKIEYNHIYVARDVNGNPYAVFKGFLHRILLDTDGTGKNPIGLVPRKEFAERLHALEEKTSSLAIVVGFSMDERERITVYVYNYHMTERRMDDNPFDKLQLDTMRNMFGGLLLGN